MRQDTLNILLRPIKRGPYRDWVDDFLLGMKWAAIWIPVLTLAFVSLAFAAEMFGE